MVEYQLYFGPLADTWYQKDFRGKRRTISANSRISSNDIYVLYSKDLARLFKGMKGLTGMVGLQEQTEFRYEYWVTDDHPTRAWTLDNASGMKYAGIKKWWEGNHRIVICPPGQRDGKRYSRLLFRAAVCCRNLTPAKPKRRTTCRRWVVCARHYPRPATSRSCPNR